MFLIFYFQMNIWKKKQIKKITAWTYTTNLLKKLP